MRVPRQHGRWLNRFDRHQEKLEQVGIHKVGKLLGCGEIGCVFEIGRNRVLKVTTDRIEASTWDIIYSEQQRDPDAMRGIATVYERPFSIRMANRRPLYGIIREKLKNLDRRLGFAGGRYYRWLKPIRRPKFIGDERPIQDLDNMATHIPESRIMAGSIRHLYLATGGIFMLADIHADNIGKRSGQKWLVLFDPGWAETPNDGKEFDRWEPASIVEM